MNIDVLMGAWEAWTGEHREEQEEEEWASERAREAEKAS